jgi:hypothetical protein
MFRAAFLAPVLSAVLVSVFAQTEPQDLIGQLHKLTLLTDNKQYREAIEGYRLLAAQPGTPGWLKAACEYETAELYGALEETDRAIAALGGAVRRGGRGWRPNRGEWRSSKGPSSPECPSRTGQGRVPSGASNRRLPRSDNRIGRRQTR